MTMQRHVFVVLVGLAVFTVNAEPCAASSITYTFFDSTGTGDLLTLKALSGVVTTDGTLGPISSASILDWTVVIQDYVETTTFVSTRIADPSVGTYPGSFGFTGGVATMDAITFGPGGALDFGGQRCFTCGVNYLWNVSVKDGQITHFFLTELSLPPGVTFTEPGDEYRLERASAPVPEPSTLWLVVTGMVVACVSRRLKLSLAK
jgi:hypothetical protein